MAFTKKSIDPNVQSRLREMAAEMRGLLYGEAGCPEWGTKFTEIETDGMSVGLELARLVMEQSVDEQTHKMPKSAMAVDDDDVIPTGTEPQQLETEAGQVDWKQPCGYQKKSRKAFFPSSPSIGADGR
jgi:hypothetical protein